MLADPVRRKSRFPPLITDGALGNDQDRRYIALTASGWSIQRARPRAPLATGVYLSQLCVLAGLISCRVSPPSVSSGQVMGLHLSGTAVFCAVILSAYSTRRTQNTVMAGRRLSPGCISPLVVLTGEIHCRPWRTQIPGVPAYSTLVPATRMTAGKGSSGIDGPDECRVRAIGIGRLGPPDGSALPPSHPGGAACSWWSRSRPRPRCGPGPD